jgi:light-regulated signal transduction histidine kinase (bacteriophytochrome)
LAADGCIVSYDGQISKWGLVPEEQQVKGLIEWLQKHRLTEVLHVTELSADYAPATSFSSTTSGILVLPIDGNSGNFVIACRGETVRNILWAGDPSKTVTFSPATNTYHPRNSFNTWKELVSKTAEAWRKEELAIAENFKYALVEKALFYKNQEINDLLEEFRIVTNFIPHLIWAANAKGESIFLTSSGMSLQI